MYKREKEKTNYLIYHLNKKLPEFIQTIVDKLFNYSRLDLEYFKRDYDPELKEKMKNHLKYLIYSIKKKLINQLNILMMKWTKQLKNFMNLKKKKMIMNDNHLLSFIS